MTRIEIDRLIDQLERGYDGHAWHGTPLRGLLEGVDAEHAARHPVAGAHSIWELTAHITFWLDVARRRVQGESLHGDDGDDWTTTSAASTADDWQKALAALEAAHQALLHDVRTLTDADLERTAADMPYSIYVLLHGVLQHSLYHAGQIAILRRAMDL